MSKGKKKEFEINKDSSAEFVTQACLEDYNHLLSLYDKIYEKVNFALGFSGIILIAILDKFNYTYLNQLHSIESNLELFSLLIYFLTSCGSTILIIWGIIQLLLLMRARGVEVVDTTEIQKQQIYNSPKYDASIWLIDKYIIAISSLKETIGKKNKEYNIAITKVIISLILYTITAIIVKGF